MGDFANLTAETTAFVTYEITDDDVLNYSNDVDIDQDDSDQASDDSDEDSGGSQDVRADTRGRAAALATECADLVYNARGAIQEWRKGAVARLASLVRGTFDSDEPVNDIEVLQRATSLFRCVQCPPSSVAYAYPSLSTHECLDEQAPVPELIAGNRTVANSFVAIDKAQRLAVPALLEAIKPSSYSTAADLVGAGKVFVIDPIGQSHVASRTTKLDRFTAHEWDIGRFVCRRA